MEFFIIIILAILVFIMVGAKMIYECPYCDGSGKKKIKIKGKNGDHVEIETLELCHSCKGTGRRK